MIKPYGVATTGDSIYVTLAGNAPGVAVINPKERKVAMLGEQPLFRFGLPTGIAAAKNGTVYVADSDQKKIHVFDEKGTHKTSFGSSEDFQRPAGLAINESLSRLYVADSFGHGVTVFSLSGQKLLRFGTVGIKEGELYYPTNVAVDRRNGNIAIADTQNFRVQVFDKDGKFLRKFGEVGDIPGNFSRPKGIAVDSDGNIYVADAGFSNIQVFDETGRLLIFFGSFGKAGGFFQSPAGMYIDENDRIYVVDALNNRVCVYQYFSDKWIKANPEEYKKYLTPSPPK
ncbi:MAG: 6-bladed beta-propeller [Nitrospirota bacterium]